MSTLSGKQLDIIEFRFEAGEGNDGSNDDLRTLYTYLANDPELRTHARVFVQREPVRPGELGAAEVVLAAVSTVVGVGQLAVAVRAWRDELNRPTTVQLVVSDEHRDNTRVVFDALRGSGPPEEQHETVIAVGAGTVGTKQMGRIDPTNSACVLIGVDRYHDRELPSLRAVYNNVEQLYEVLTDENPLLENVEGMAVGPEETTGPEKGSRLLYLITDDNSNSTQITRLYAFRIRLPS